MVWGAAGREEGTTAARVLDQLAANAGVPVSGSTLSRRLGVSRSAIWKAVALLKGAGVPVVSLQSRGYLLEGAENLLLASRITSLRENPENFSRIHVFPVTESTNADAVRMAEEGEIEGTVILADSQTAGKGRLGRRWESPPGCNLYCSVILRPSIPPHLAPQITFLAAVALRDAVTMTTGVDVSLKWPNDLIVNGRKAAGLLNEMSAEADRVRHLVLGFGVNVNQTTFPGGFRTPPTSLAREAGRSIDRSLLAARLLDRLHWWYRTYLSEGFEPIRRTWMDASCSVGVRVSISDTDGVPRLTGETVGIDEVGALLLEDAAGRIHHVAAGDVTILEGDRCCS